MRLPTLLIALAALAGLAVAAPASAHSPHRYSPKHGAKCRKGYKRVKHHHKVFCVKRRKSSAKAAAPSLARTKLHAHLDPTYTRDPLDPFKVTYAYSASATQELVGSQGSISTEEPAPLPSGVLSFFADGKLECAVNVGGAINSSQCPVTYEALGEHRVTTIYSSGEQSATETEVENIGPLGTTTTLTVSYTPYVHALSNFGCGDGSACLIESGWHENGGFQVGILTVRGSVSPWNTPPNTTCPVGDSGCSSLALDPGGERSFPVKVIASYTALEEKEVTIGETIALEPEAIKHVTVGGIAEATLAEIVTGAFHFHASAGPHSGYAESSTNAPIQFTPEVIGPVERIPLT